MLQVENVFNLEVIGEGTDTQLSLSWRTLDEKKKETDFCENCGTIELNKKIRNLISNLVTTKTFKIKNQSTSFANVNIDIIDRHFHHLFIYNGHSYAVSRVPFSWSRIIEMSKITKGYPIKISSNEENSEIRKHFASLTSYRSLLIGLTDVLRFLGGPLILKLTPNTPSPIFFPTKTGFEKKPLPEAFV